MNEETGIDPENIENGDELYERFSITVDRGQEPLRIDKFLINRIERGTRNKIQQAINTGMVLVNGKEIRPNYKVRPADEIVVFSDTDPEETEVVPENIPLNIVFEDPDIMVINKPIGMVVHPGSGNYHGTLLNGIAYHLRQQNPEINENVLPR
ncbi:MAG: RNA pseudouridine synthase, partial [Chitinophagaceae bacterium]